MAETPGRVARVIAEVGWSDLSTNLAAIRDAQIEGFTMGDLWQAQLGIAPALAQVGRIDESLQLAVEIVQFHEHEARHDDYNTHTTAAEALSEVGSELARLGRFDDLLQIALTAAGGRDSIFRLLANTLVEHGQAPFVLRLLESAQHDLMTCLPVIAAIMKAHPQNSAAIATLVLGKLRDNKWFEPVTQC